MNKPVSCFYISMVLSCYPATAFAYIGPGAGILLIGPMIALVSAVGIAIAMLLIWPYRAYRKRLKQKHKENEVENGGNASSAPNAPE